MNYFKKNIGMLTIILTSIMFASHEIIPHHHHFDSVYSHVSDSTNDCDGKENNKEQDHNRIHCHAFNESFTGKIKVVDSKLKAFSSIADLYAYCHAIIKTINTPDTSRLVAGNFELPDQTYPGTNPPLRAPPCEGSHSSFYSPYQTRL